MKPNAVVFGAVSIMDISDSTVTPETLGEGATAYDKSGEKITGTMKSGIDTSDATATETDIIEGQTAYINGEKVTGTIKRALGGITDNNATVEKASGMPYAQMTHTVTESTVISPNYGGTIKLQAPLTEFGDATAEDVAVGKTFTSADGLKVTGTVPILTDMTTLTFDEVYDEPDAGKIYATGYPEAKAIVTPDTPLEIPFNLSVFGDATAKDVAKGKTFTSADGFVVTGTHECEAGLDTSDATATASDMAQGVTAYVNGEKVTGTVLTISPGQSVNFPNATLYEDETNNKVGILGEAVTPTLLRQSATVQLAVSMDSFGDATAADVAAGKTFTSAAGLKVEGTKEDSPATQAVVLVAEATPSENSLTLEFTGLSGEPTLFSVHPKENITLGSTRYILGVDYDGENTVGIQGYSSGSFMSSSATATYSATAFSWTYANGTLTVTSGSATTGGYFMSGISYQLVYITDTLTQGEESSGAQLPDGAIAVQIVKAAEASTQVGSGYSLSITYGDAVEISDSIALAFSGTTETLSNISDTTDFSVLLGKYIRSGSTTTAKYYYIPNDATFTVGSSGYSKTLTCDKAQAVSMQKVST